MRVSARTVSASGMLRRLIKTMVMTLLWFSDSYNTVPLLLHSVSEAAIKAHVHCIIVGFSYRRTPKTWLYDSAGNRKSASNINQYLTAAPTAIIESRSTPIADIPAIRFGSMPRDGGGFILREEEKNALIDKEPLSEQCIRI